MTELKSDLNKDIGVFHKSYLIVGQPNSGKTELFNALTHSHATVGNWSGVTVATESATLNFHGKTLTIQDTPGIYTLMHNPKNEDEKITHHILTHTTPDMLINVIDVTQLERQLILTSELLELEIPMIIVLNKTHLAEKNGILINIKALSAAFACKVFVFNFHTNLEEITKNLFLPHTKLSALTLPISENLLQQISFFKQQNKFATQFQAIQHVLMSSDIYDLEFAQARYNFVKAALSASSSLAPTNTTEKEYSRLSLGPTNTTKTLDNILLHRYLGLPLFFIMMYSLFFFAIHVGNLFQNLFDSAINTIFIYAPTIILNNLNAPLWLTALLIDGFGKGLNTTISFIPVLCSLYVGLSFLEGSGYMPRAAFLMDRFMRTIGLPGKSFVPLIIGFGCNVPAILATRTLENKQERLLTILLSPFMSCSARLTIYTVFTNAFFPHNGQNIIFSLYILGIAVAILTAFIFKKILYPYNLTPLTLELPQYQCPQLQRLLKISFKRLSLFLKRAAKIIIPVCVVLSLFNILPAPNSSAPNFLAYFGQLITPIFIPMGLTIDNWPATVGLFTGVLAKEVVIGSLNTLYQQTDAVGLYQIMQQRFHNFASVYAYLTFILLYLPCVSTMSAIKQETTAKIMWLAVFWSFSCAYILSTLIYQIGSFSSHPTTSIVWLVLCMLFFIALPRLMKKIFMQQTHTESIRSSSPKTKQVSICMAHSCAGICTLKEASEKQ